MNLKENAYIVYVALLLVTINSCKYEDGPLISLVSPKKRVAQKWKLDKIIIDGKEKELTADEKDDTWEYSEDGHVFYTNPGVNTETGSWEFLNNEKQIRISFPIQSPPGNSIITYNILKLNKNKFWTEQDISDQVEIHLKR